MSLEKKAFIGASWLGLFNILSQLFSWAITILIARILVPSDYGLMEMSTIITGYAALFSELGLGASIIQRPTISQKDLSSIFWFSLIVSIVLACGCVIIAYPTAYIFHDRRIIPLTSSVSIIFILTGMQIIPINLLRKEIKFKVIGIIEMATTIIACCSMYVIALLGGGVWTLMGGMIIRQLARTVLLYMTVKWLPAFHFNIWEVKSYLGFGIYVALANSLFYFRGTSDKLFAGMMWTPDMLGYYSFALSLAVLPTDKITAVINQVAFPAFSKLQNDNKRSNDFYLRTIKVTALLVLPLFMGGYLIGEDLVILLLGGKWLNSIIIFRYLCLAQIIRSLNAINSFVHLGQGRSRWEFNYNLVSAILVPVSFYFAIKSRELDVILIPWFATYSVICCVWIIITLKKIGIRLSQYLEYLSQPILAVSTMSAAVLIYQTIIQHDFPSISRVFSLCLQITIGGAFYIGYLLVFDRSFVFNIRKFIGK